jgi:hypothetical protein
MNIHIGLLLSVYLSINIVAVREALYMDMIDP